MKKLLNKTTKVCCRCSVEKPLDDFHKETKGSSGRQGKCKSCNTISRREYSSRSPDSNWKMNIRRMGLTPEEYNEIHTAQGGVCASCGGLEKSVDKRTGRIRRLAVDHDHSCCPDRTACKKCIRGLLCQSCNQALGILNDDLGRIASLARYLEKNRISC
jgi:hypothetical protein